jgi:hypothetical protein
MTTAILTNTPLPTVWDTFTIGLICRVMKAAPTVVPLLNPFAASGDDDKPITDPDTIRAMAAGLGVARKQR